MSGLLLWCFFISCRLYGKQDCRFGTTQRWLNADWIFFFFGELSLFNKAGNTVWLKEATVSSLLIFPKHWPSSQKQQSERTTESQKILLISTAFLACFNNRETIKMLDVPSAARQRPAEGEWAASWAECPLSPPFITPTSALRFHGPRQEGWM